MFVKADTVHVEPLVAAAIALHPIHLATCTHAHTHQLKNCTPVPVLLHETYLLAEDRSSLHSLHLLRRLKLNCCRYVSRSCQCGASCPADFAFFSYSLFVMVLLSSYPTCFYLFSINPVHLTFSFALLFFLFLQFSYYIPIKINKTHFI